MAASLTPLQARLLRFIKGYILVEGGAPSFAEMQVGLGLSSKGGIYRLLEALEERGHIRRLPNRTRCIELLEKRDLDDVPTDELIAAMERRGFKVIPLGSAIPEQDGAAAAPPHNAKPPRQSVSVPHHVSAYDQKGQRHHG